MSKRPGIRRFALKCTVLGLAVPLLTGVRAPLPSAPHPEEIGRPQPRATVVRDAVAWEEGAKIARAVYRPNFVAGHADAETMARQFLAERSDMLRLEDPALGDLQSYFSREGLAETTVRFRQTHQGLPVLGDDIAVTIDRSDRVIFAVNGYEQEIDLASTTPAFPAAEARRIAVDYLGIDGPLAYDKTTLAVLPDKADSRLVYQVKLVPGTEPHGDWEALVDARTGELVRVVNNAAHLDGSGLTFDPDPLSSAGAAYGGSYQDNSDATNAALDAERVSVTLKDITDLGGTYKLAGPYAEIVDSESPFEGLFTQGSATFNYDRSDQAFEAVLCYYHIDHILRYLNETLGVSVSPTQYSGGARFDPHGLSGSDNSHYLSSTGQVAFGEGGVDDSEDADVVIHELGHGLHDWLTGGNLSQVEGLSEGCGDYIAQSYSRSLGQWSSGDAAWNWVFNWDGHNPYWAGRITNYSAHYPGGLVGQVHTDGQIWATSLMTIWNQIGRDQMDRAFCEGLAMTGGSSSQNDAAQAVLNAASALGYPSSDLTAIYNGFTATGYTITAPIASLVTEEPVFTSAGGNNAADPGETVSFELDVTNIGSVAATSVSAVLTSSTPGVVVVQGASNYPDLGAGATGTNVTDYTITLPLGLTCGDQVALTLDIDYLEDGTPGSTMESAAMQTGEVIGVSQSLSPGLAIPDNNSSGVTSVMSVSGTGGTVTANLNVDINITHTWIGDLIVRLTSPGGTQVTLHNRTGSSADNIIGNYPLTLTPYQSLASMIGDPIDGDWKLFVSDNAGQDLGTINSWGVNDVSGYDCDDISTDVAAGESLPLRFALDAAQPNPFRPSTMIRFAVPGSGADVALDVFDVSGRHVKTLVSGFQSSGEYAVSWDGSNESGRRVAAGVYFYRMQSPGFHDTKKVTFLK